MDLTRPYPPEPYSLLPNVRSFVLTSQDVVAGKPMGNRHSQAGGSISPQLAWSGLPQGTMSLALSCFDPDAPTPAGFWHWTVLNLPVSLTEVPTDFGNPANALPSGAVRGRNDADTVGYFGAAPPPGDHSHRYIFAVHALDDMLDLTDGVGCTWAAFTMLFHTIGRATLVPTYQIPA